MSGSYYQPDTTGSLPAYAVTGDLYTVFTASQRIEFENTLFLDSLSITIVGPSNTAFVQNVDWEIVDTVDVDYTMMSKLQNIDSSFSQTLIKSILIISPTAMPYQINCSYQQVYPVPSKIAVSASGAVEVTPDLIVEILQRLSNAEVILSGVPTTFAGTNATPKLLPIDLAESLSTNVVTETQTVNTFQNQNVIRPTCGSFFSDTVSLTLAGATSALVEGTDYILFGANLAKIKMSSSTAGIYDFILVLTPYAGNISVTYHAFGGDVTLYDMNAIYAEVNNINQYLTNMNFLTASSLGLSPIFQQLITRISNVESTMRNLIATGNPNYSDATGNGTAVVQKIRSVDTDLHWWTISSLYTVSGSNSVVIADRQHFRMQMLTANLAADVYVNVNLNNPTVFTIDSISINQDLGYVPFTSYGTIAVTMPQFRIVYNNVADVSSGILLQIGLELPTLTETISIQDLSGSESCWILEPSDTTAALPSDDSIVLPNATQTWDSTYDYSLSSVHMMPNKTGYLAWGGAMAVSGMSTAGTVLTNPLIDYNYVLGDVDHIRLQFTETSNTENVITIDIPVTSLSDATTISGSALIQNTPTDNTSIIMGITLNITGTTVTLTITPSIIPSGTTLTLRHVLLMFAG